MQQDAQAVLRWVSLCVQISTEEIREMEREEAWEPTTRIPVVDEDILEVGYCQNRKDYTFWRYARLPKEKPGDIPGCPKRSG